MDKILLIATCIALMFRESQLSGTSEASVDLVREIISTVEVTDITLTGNYEKEMIVSLKQTAREVLAMVVVEPINREWLISRIQFNMVNDDTKCELVCRMIEDTIPEAELKFAILRHRKTLENHLKEIEVGKILQKAMTEFRTQRDKIKDMTEFVEQVRSNLEKHSVAIGAKDPAVVSEFVLSDTEAVRGEVKLMKVINDDRGILRVGWQGLNEMMQGGIRRNDFVLLSAPKHHNKSGFTRSVFSHIAWYNNPYLFGKNKKPALMYIMLEDHTSQGLGWFYKTIYETETKSFVSMADINATPDEEIIRLIQKSLGINGFEIIILKVNPSDWSYKHLQNKVLEYEAKGYEICFCAVDYLNMLNKNGCEKGGTHGADIHDLFRRTKNFFEFHKIPFWTPHQMSPKAKEHIAAGHQQIAKLAVDAEWYDGSTKIGQEATMEIHISKLKHNGNTYQEIAGGKHRLPTVIDDKLKYMILPFQKVGGLVPDLFGPPTHSRKLGAPADGSESSENDIWV